MDTAVGRGPLLEVLNGRAGAGGNRNSPAAALGACAHMAATLVSYPSRRTPASRTGPARALGGERGNRLAGR